MAEKPAGPVRSLTISDAEMRRNISNSLRFPQFQPGGESGAIAICAAGPSLLNSVALVKALRRSGVPVCAIKGTADILLAAGIVPTYVVSMDGREDQIRFFAAPHPAIEYLIAGQSHPKVFEALTGYRVTVWHGEGKQYLPAGTNYVLGGSTTGSRAVSLMWAKGYSVQHLFGFDCCEMDDQTHVYPTREQKLVDVYLGSKRFRTTGPMIYQYKEFLDHFGGDRRISITVHGNGMLAEAWSLVGRGVTPNLALAPYSIAA
jgi:uncharacterized Rossmann fold enzyme